MKQPIRILAAILSLHLLAVARGADSIAEKIPLRAAASDRVSARPELVITTLGFGSCARQNRPQPIWDTINAARCDAFVLCGDNIYGDSPNPAVPRKPQPNRHRLHERPYFTAMKKAAAVGLDHQEASYREQASQYLAEAPRILRHWRQNVGVPLVGALLTRT